ncbi:MAG TPA: TadE/TadG family type IV pilus assembly protein [Allosphingosinicella sp.]|jgi:Flp pilus assembly protein TadG
MQTLASFRALSRDERGVSVIEFGFLAPVLAMLAMGIIDLSRGLSERFSLQQAVNRSLELVQSRPARANENATDVDYSFVEDEAIAAAGDGATVTLTRWRECNGVEATPYADSCPEGQDQARYLRVRITKSFAGEFYFDTIPMAASGALRIQ